jgi:hypothetical protein
MYRKGELQITVPPCAEMLADPNGECFSDKHEHHIYDARGSKENPVGTAFLPHSCDAWVIGGKEQIKALIGELQEILTKMEMQTFEIVGRNQDGKIVSETLKAHPGEIAITKNEFR